MTDTHLETFAATYVCCLLQDASSNVSKEKQESVRRKKHQLASSSLTGIQPAAAQQPSKTPRSARPASESTSQQQQQHQQHSPSRLSAGFKARPASAAVACRDAGSVAASAGACKVRSLTDDHPSTAIGHTNSYAGCHKCCISPSPSKTGTSVQSSAKAARPGSSSASKAAAGGIRGAKASSREEPANPSTMAGQQDLQMVSLLHIQHLAQSVVVCRLQTAGSSLLLTS